MFGVEGRDRERTGRRRSSMVETRAGILVAMVAAKAASRGSGGRLC